MIILATWHTPSKYHGKVPKSLSQVHIWYNTYATSTWYYQTSIYAWNYTLAMSGQDLRYTTWPSPLNCSRFTGLKNLSQAYSEAIFICFAKPKQNNNVGLREHILLRERIHWLKSYSISSNHVDLHIRSGFCWSIAMWYVHSRSFVAFPYRQVWSSINTWYLLDTFKQENA